MRAADHPRQRVILHLMCLCKRPRHAWFHLCGIARELPHLHL